MRPLANALTEAGSANLELSSTGGRRRRRRLAGSFADVASSPRISSAPVAAKEQLDVNRVSPSGPFAPAGIFRAVVGRVIADSRRTASCISANPLPIARRRRFEGLAISRRHCAAATGVRRPCDHRLDRRITRAADRSLSGGFADRAPAVRTRQIVLAGRMFGPQTPAYEAASRRRGCDRGVCQRCRSLRLHRSCVPTCGQAFSRA
jgi:hypothetical protein